MKKALSLLVAIILTVSVFSFTASAAGNVSVTPTEHGTVTYTPLKKALLITIIPDAGYEIDFGTILEQIGPFGQPICDISPEDVIDNEYRFPLEDSITGDLTISVFFKKSVPTPPQGGNITVTDSLNGHADYSLIGSELSVNIYPDDGYELDFGVILHKMGAFEEPVYSIEAADVKDGVFTCDLGALINDDLTISVFFKAKPALMKGDFDKDKEITVADALAALRVSVKLAPEDEESIAIGDIDGDNHVTVSDALAILRVAAKLVPSL